MTTDRRQDAYRTRVEAAELARSREHPPHRANGDEERWACSRYAMSFTKGLDHDPATGLIKESGDFLAFRTAIDNGFIDPFTANVPSSPQMQRQWEAPTAGVVFDLEGPDAQALTMAPAPALGSVELAYEMAEVYELSMLRDVPFTAFEGAVDANNPVSQSIERLNAVTINGRAFTLDGSDGCRPRKTDAVTQGLTPQTAFRGASPGTDVGPYLSQFMLIGNVNRAGSDRIDKGRITYGTQQIDQRVLEPFSRAEDPARADYMLTKDDWLAVQNGIRPADNSLKGARRFITTPRDLAQYVHFDQLYQAYLNACLILLEMGAPLDPGFNDLSGTGNLQVGNDSLGRKASGFALFGGPHILTLVTEVATRALKAVRYQKFNNHIRLRPEALAGRIAMRGSIQSHFGDLGTSLNETATAMGDTLNALGNFFPLPDGPFLPMAFPEGSPMHPAYGAGHATVAGACVTILKAFFDTNAKLRLREGDNVPVRQRVTFGCPEANDKPVAYLPPPFPLNGQDDRTLREFVEQYDFLTLEGELNKLAANISIGRNMAGVHYFSDYYDSVRMGEAIAIGMLEEQALCYPADRFVLSVPTFDGDVVRIGAR